MLKKLIISTIFLFGFVYIAWPGPYSIEYFPSLPASLKSDEPGDTYQNKNIAAYFSNNRRSAIMDYYQDNFEHLRILGIKIPSLRLNYPPESAFLYIRDQQQSMYLEEFIYPFRESLFVNGVEPFDENNRPYRVGATNLIVNGEWFTTKTTLKYYPSNILIRIYIYILTWFLGYLLFKLYIKVIRGKVI